MRQDRLIRCLACGHIYERDLEMCPRRYLSPHTPAFMEKVAQALTNIGTYTVGDHLRIVEELARV